MYIKRTIYIERDGRHHVVYVYEYVYVYVYRENDMWRDKIWRSPRCRPGKLRSGSEECAYACMLMYMYVERTIYIERDGGHHVAAQESYVADLRNGHMHVCVCICIRICM